MGLRTKRAGYFIFLSADKNSEGKFFVFALFSITIQQLNDVVIRSQPNLMVEHVFLNRVHHWYIHSY